VVAFGCVALFMSTTLFVLSQWHRSEPIDASPIPVAATVTAVPAPPPPQPTPPAVAESVAPAPAPTPVVLAPAPPPVAVAPPPPAVSAPPPIASEPPPAPAPAPVASAPAPAAPVPVETAVAAPAPVPNPTPAAADTQQADALLARGDDMLATGDVSAARLFYQRAAELGSAAAATAVGQTYDPGVLELLRVRGARGDAQLAAEWYRKAIAAGDRQAEIRLKRLQARTSG
jgi:outer membrane biosynthesis protein TonB